MTAMIRDSFDRCDHHQGPNEIVQIHVLKPPKVRAEKKRTIHGNFHVPNFATEKKVSRGWAMCQCGTFSLCRSYRSNRSFVPFFVFTVSLYQLWIVFKFQPTIIFIV